MAKIKIMNPVTSARHHNGGREVALPALSDLLAGGREPKIAYLSNGKPNTRELLSLMDAELEQTYRVRSRFFDKESPAHPAPDTTTSQIRKFADLAMIATAD